MASTLSAGTIQTTFGATLSQLIPPPVQNSSKIQQNLTFTPATGNGVGGWDRCYSTLITVTHGTPLVINLTSGLDPLGNALVILHLMAVELSNGSTTSGQDFSMGGGTNPVNSDVRSVPANGGWDLWQLGSIGLVIVPSTNDQITITVAAGTAVPGQLTIFGRSA